MKKLILLLALAALLCGCSSDAPIVSTAPFSHTIETPVSSELTSSESASTPIIIDEGDFPSLEENFAEITKTSRKRGTAGEENSRDYLHNQLKNYGYEVSIQEFDIFEVSNAEMAQNDYFELNPLDDSPVAQGYNVIADLNYDRNKKTVVVSAHYDTTTDSVGALDNATGTVAVLEAAKIIRKQQFDYNVRIIFFSSEEYKFYGSRSYLNSLSKAELSNIYGCFNVDMVGSKDCRKTIILSPVLEENWITTNYRRVDYEYEFRQGGSSDNIPFSKKGIPAVHFTTVDTRDEKFDTSLFNSEVNIDAVSLENLKIDVELVVRFIENIDIGVSY